MLGSIARQLPGALVLIAVCTLANGCATSGFVGDRRRDAADIFTLTVGAGGGGKIRVGPLQLAVLENADLAGLRAGRLFGNGSDLHNNGEIYIPLPRFLRRPAWGEPIAGKVFVEQEGRVSDYRTDDVRFHSPSPQLEWNDLFGREVFSHGLDTPSSHRGKDVAARSPFPLIAVGASAPFNSNIEFAVGLVLSLRVGINPGELLDYIVGLGGGDLYGDDLGDSKPWESPVILEVPVDPGRKAPPFVRVKKKDNKGDPTWELVQPPKKRGDTWKRVERKPDEGKPAWHKLDEKTGESASTWKKLDKTPKRDVVGWKKVGDKPRKDEPAWETVEDRPEKDVVSWKKVREIHRVEAIPGEKGNEHFRSSTTTNDARSR
jgi:hypothetical protein